MAAVPAEDSPMSFPRGLSEWWNEETEYVFQRIERWAAFARGYNRLRSQRLSKGRMTMDEERTGTRWNISSNKLTIDEPWNPQFHTLRRSHRRKTRPEEAKINCCGTFNYQSNSNIDSTCLETYRYDHSIYFKTIGDIKSSKKDPNRNDEERVSISSEELVEWDASSISDSIKTYVNEKLLEEQRANEILEVNSNDSFKYADEDVEDVVEDVNSNYQSSWPLVDFTKLDINLNNTINDGTGEIGLDNEPRDTAIIEVHTEAKDEISWIVKRVANENNNNVENTAISGLLDTAAVDNNTCATNKQTTTDGGFRRFLGFRRSRRSLKNERKTNTVWSGIYANVEQAFGEIPFR